MADIVSKAVVPDVNSKQCSWPSAIDWSATSAGLDEIDPQFLHKDVK